MNEEKDVLYHYGVKGMKWRVRRGATKAATNAVTKNLPNRKKKSSLIGSVATNAVKATNKGLYKNKTKQSTGKAATKSGSDIVNGVLSKFPSKKKSSIYLSPIKRENSSDITSNKKKKKRLYMVNR